MARAIEHEAMPQNDPPMLDEVSFAKLEQIVNQPPQPDSPSAKVMKEALEAFKLVFKTA